MRSTLTLELSPGHGRPDTSRRHHAMPRLRSWSLHNLQRPLLRLCQLVPESPLGGLLLPADLRDLQTVVFRALLGLTSAPAEAVHFMNLADKTASCGQGPDIVFADVVPKRAEREHATMEACFPQLSIRRSRCYALYFLKSKLALALLGGDRVGYCDGDGGGRAVFFFFVCLVVHLVVLLRLSLSITTLCMHDAVTMPSRYNLLLFILPVTGHVWLLPQVRRGLCLSFSMWQKVGSHSTNCWLV